MGAIGAPSPGATELMATVSRHFSGLTVHGGIGPVFLGHPADVRSSLLALQPTHQLSPVLDLSGYYHAYFASRGEAQTAVAQLRLTLMSGTRNSAAPGEAGPILTYSGLFPAQTAAAAGKRRRKKEKR
jgi:hypothetical protein